MNGRVAIKRTLPEPIHFERLFVNRRTVLIFDPSVVSLVPLVRDNPKRAMSKRSSKKSKRRSKTVVPALGITGLSLSLASGATASTGEAADALTSQPHQLFLGE